MKIWLKNEEWYPVVVVDEEKLGTEIDVPESTVSRWAAALAEFERVQEEMQKAKETMGCSNAPGSSTPGGQP